MNDSEMGKHSHSTVEDSENPSSNGFDCDIFVFDRVSTWLFEDLSIQSDSFVKTVSFRSW